MGTEESPPQPQLTRESLVVIASQGRNPENKERILAGLPKKIQEKLDFTGPKYDSHYGFWDALLETQLGETHPALQEDGRQKLVGELYETLLSFGFDVSDKSLPFDRLVEAYLKSLNIQPPERPPKLGIRQRIADSRRIFRAMPLPAEILAAEAPTEEAPKDLLGQLNKTLSETTGNTAGVEVSPNALADYLKTVSLPLGSGIKEVNVQVVNNQLIVNGSINTPVVGTSTFTATLENDSSGGLKVVEHILNLPLLARSRRGQIEGSVTNLNQILTDEINKKIDPAWETTNFQISGNNLAFEFKKKNISPTEPLRAEMAAAPEAGPTPLLFGQESLPSINHPERNEDSYFVNKDLGLMGVFDGMGGMATGDIASQTARDTVQSMLQQIPKDTTPQQIEQRIREVLKSANEKVRQAAPGGGTTASVVKTWTGSTGEQKLIIGHVGDSRVWLLKNDGTLLGVTDDDGVLRNAFLGGAITEDQYKLLSEELDTVKAVASRSADAQFYFERRNAIARYLGMASFACDTKIVDVEPGDLVLLTSDGVHDNLTTDQIREILQQSQNPQEIAKLLTQKAQAISQGEEPGNDRAKPDDITAVAIKVG